MKPTNEPQHQTTRGHLVVGSEAGATPRIYIGVKDPSDQTSGAFLGLDDARKFASGVLELADELEEESKGDPG